MTRGVYVEGKRATAPQWAVDLSLRVFKDQGFSYRNDAGIPQFSLLWYNGRGPRSQGRTSHNNSMGHTVLFSAGSETVDQKLVLLHELAHVLQPLNTREYVVTVKGTKETREWGLMAGHTAAFWDTAFRLYEEYDLDLNAAYSRERGYKRAAAYAAARRGIQAAMIDIEGRRNARKQRATCDHEWQTFSSHVRRDRHGDVETRERRHCWVCMKGEYTEWE